MIAPIPGGPGSGDPIRDEIVETVDRLHRALGFWPSPKIVAEHTGLSRTRLQYHVNLLVADGRLEKLHGGRVLRTVPQMPKKPPVPQ